jgi:hypothetical protein
MALFVGLIGYCPFRQVTTSGHRCCHCIELRSGVLASASLPLDAFNYGIFILQATDTAGLFSSFLTHPWIITSVGLAW